LTTSFAIPIIANYVLIVMTITKRLQQNAHDFCNSKSNKDFATVIVYFGLLTFYSTTTLN